MDRRRRALLPWRVNVQHVCNEPGTIPNVSRGQKSRAVEPPSTYSFYFFTGKQLLPSSTYLKNAATLPFFYPYAPVEPLLCEERSGFSWHRDG